MARIEEKIAEIADPALRQSIGEEVAKLKKHTRFGLVFEEHQPEVVPIFGKQSYLMGDEYSMLDVAITPLLWRLGHYGIELPNQAAPLLKYAERLFSRPMYAEAMTPSEKAMRK